MDWIRSAGGGTNRRPLLKHEILEAQRNTKSGSEAARWIGTSYVTYKKYAKIYGIFENHKNQAGAGVAKPHKSGLSGYPLKEILAGVYPNYDPKRLKKRLITSGILDEKCSLCGFTERRILDYKVPLMLCYKDSNSKNHRLENLLILCFNCAFLTTGNLNGIHPHRIKSLSKPEGTPILAQPENNLPDEMADWQSAIDEAKSELEGDNENLHD